jgi:hypothetical protein
VQWDGCNECRVIMDTGTGVYATFVMTVVASEDASRSIVPSCPSLGWTGQCAIHSMMRRGGGGGEVEWSMKHSGVVDWFRGQVVSTG